MNHPQGDSRRTPVLPRVTSGIPELDFILGGGFPESSINVVMGEPGSGKTILVERMVFANATGDRPILYLTTLSEPLDKVVRYLQQFTFFDEDKLLTGAVVYDTIAEELATEGVAALLPRLKAIIKEIGPKIIVVDSFKAIHDLGLSVHEMRRALYEVSGLLAAYQATVFLVGEYAEPMVSTYPEFAIADGIVELARKKEGTRDERFLRVLKARGSDYQEGLHAFRIGAGGIEVFPRLTSPVLPPSYELAVDERTASGIPGLDARLAGGLRTGSTTLIEGPTGTGKTTIALQFVLEGLRRGEPGLYVNFQENPTQLARTIRGLGWDVDEALAKGLHLLYSSPVELQIDSILVELFAMVQEKGIRRVSIDAMGDLVQAASDTRRVLGYFYALGQHFQVRRATTMMTLESSVARESVISGQVSAMCDTLLAVGLEHDGDIARRTFRILKARGTPHDLNVCRMAIGPNGVELE